MASSDQLSFDLPGFEIYEVRRQGQAIEIVAHSNRKEAICARLVSNPLEVCIATMNVSPSGLHTDAVTVFLILSCLIFSIVGKRDIGTLPNSGARSMLKGIQEHGGRRHAGFRNDATNLLPLLPANFSFPQLLPCLLKSDGLHLPISLPCPPLDVWSGCSSNIQINWIHKTCNCEINCSSIQLCKRLASSPGIFNVSCANVNYKPLTFGFSLAKRPTFPNSPTSLLNCVKTIQLSVRR